MNTFNYQIFALSERCLTLQLEPVISEPQIRWLYALRERILIKNIRGVQHVWVTFHELTIQYDVDVVNFERLQDNVEVLLAERPHDMSQNMTVKPRHITIPICYEDEMAWDKDRLVSHCGLSFEDLIHIHHEQEYIFYMFGFLPGFLYLGGLDPRLACPRLEKPRQNIQKGSVGIAGHQTGVYPMASPGGWNIIGRTPLDLFDYTLSTAPAIDDLMIRPLDRIRFTPVSRLHFKALEGKTVNEYQKLIKTT
ncbi:5-oxoprolinase subunit PxpB [Membranicola marinus]|uniref:5-oxoprolinase subunit PxpB n=1 Tax=Membranihabitans marinus TaxID=1227546 RepID=A0A953L6Y4_9BACT|nr:5-oxoprolinase subunit PxpB [Membranihabitans marinus]MBY5958152.1 5-oxoprolinase subunit PxpB [Membranihabitans marinus]